VSPLEPELDVEVAPLDPPVAPLDDAPPDALAPEELVPPAGAELSDAHAATAAPPTETRRARVASRRESLVMLGKDSG
jgi:hypothetical protein